MVSQSGKVSRSTKQRQLILEELRKVFTHPTADEVYEMVRCRLPSISLGTVYRNLEKLADHGLIQKVDTGGNQRRFDGNPAPHYHIRCMGCGRLDDIPGKATQSFDHLAETLSDYEIWGHRLEFQGLCPQCRAQASAPQAYAKAGDPECSLQVVTKSSPLPAG
jgi:Fur family transcriptional regulator, ferric uptake regulator